LVTGLEQSVIDLCAEFHIRAFTKKEAPGVYVDKAKICSVGLRIRRGASYHGLALNVAMDLEPFSRINPCGFQGLIMGQLSTLGGPKTTQEAGEKLVGYLMKNLGYNDNPDCAKVSTDLC
jgi:lipoyl(octanoyl) transferase